MEDNPRFHYAVKICKSLGIDDPIYWMNNTDPRLLDLWIADYIFDAEGTGGHRKPESVLGELLNKVREKTDGD